MKKMSLLFCFIVIPLTLFLCAHLPGRAYYITSTLVIMESLIPFFFAFESKKPSAREMCVVAVLCALAVAARVAIPLPNFKAIFAIIILSAIAFGAESGFLVGAVSAFASNFFYGQGPFTPWQMLAYGMAGLVAGFVFKKKWLSQKPVTMGVFGFFCVLLLIGPMLDTASVFIMLPAVTWETALPLYLSGLPVNISQGICTFLTILLIGKPFLEKLDRVKCQYGMLVD